MGNSNFVLTYVNPADMSQAWVKIKDGLGKIKEHSTDSWMVEDVYMSLKNNQSTLHIGEVDGEYAGFMILTPLQSYDGAILHVWATYSKARQFCVFTEGMEHIKQFAKNLNAKRITFLSPRKGWLKQGAKIGFKPINTQYAMELGE